MSIFGKLTKTNHMNFQKLIYVLKAAPVAEQKITDQSEIDAKYAYWRKRILISTMIGYALFYFVRKNLSVAMPAIEHELGITKADLGLFLTLHGVIYGVSKFLNGFIADRANPRYFMAIGLFMSAIMSFFFGLSNGVIAFGLFWIFNGWFQGMGFPAVTNSLTHWFSPKERGMKFGIWNTSHSIGAGLVLVLSSFLVIYDWRLCFIVPSILAIIGVVVILMGMRDRPESMGLPSIEQYHGDDIEQKNDLKEEHISFAKLIRQNVFSNPYIWILSLANMFLYVIRYVILDWGPTFLTEMKGLELKHAGWVVAAFEASGILGMLLGGWLMDRVFKGRGGRAALIYMIICTIAVFLFWKLPFHNITLYVLLLSIIGFSIYGPQALVAIIAANLATKRAAATATGLTGLFGYLSTIISGWGLGVIVTNGGWSMGFLTLVISGSIAAILFAFTWNAGHIVNLKK